MGPGLSHTNDISKTEAISRAVCTTKILADKGKFFIDLATTRPSF